MDLMLKVEFVNDSDVPKTLIKLANRDMCNVSTDVYNVLILRHKRQHNVF